MDVPSQRQQAWEGQFFFERHASSRMALLTSRDATWHVISGAQYDSVERTEGKSGDNKSIH
jgi:hypothetical protein